MQTGVHGELGPDRWVGWRPSARLRSAAPAATIAVIAAALVAFEPTAAVTTFATVFLGVFFEALPFLLLDVLFSAIVQELVPPSGTDGAASSTLR
jgi:uncharacterized BrkB/YihY/UPF0761 family membrane protein